MDPLTMAAIMAGVGVVKGELVDRPREARERKVAAETQRWSPWTGMQAGQIHTTDTLGNAMQGGVAGYQLGQNAKAAEGISSKPSAGGVSGYNLGLAETAPNATQNMNPMLQYPDPNQSLYQNTWNGMRLINPKNG